MTTPLWCLFIVILLPLPLSFLGAYFRGQTFGSPDNKDPRGQAAKLEGTGARVYAAQSNAWEASILFTAAVLGSHAAGLSAEAAAPWTIAFVVFRILHAIFYVVNIDVARSVVFLGSIVCVVGLFIKAG